MHISLSFSSFDLCSSGPFHSFFFFWKKETACLSFAFWESVMQKRKEVICFEDAWEERPAFHSHRFNNQTLLLLTSCDIMWRKKSFPRVFRVFHVSPTPSSSPKNPNPSLCPLLMPFFSVVTADYISKEDRDSLQRMLLLLFERIFPGKKTECSHQRI